MKRKQETTKDTTEEKPETKLEPAQDWTKVLYAPRTDLDLLDLDNNESHLLEREKPDNLMNKMHYLFGTVNKDEKFYFTKCPSHTVININLNSADSRLIKIGNLFILCRDILNGLKQERFKKNKKDLFFQFFSFGIVNLLSRILSLESFIGHRSPPPYAAMFLSSCLSLDANFLRYTHYRFDIDRFESLALEAAPDMSEAFIKNRAFISLADFKAVITRQLPHMPYRCFVKNYVTCFQRILHLINSKEYMENFSKLLLFNPATFDSAKKFFKPMKELFLQQKTRILREERELLFADLKLFPVSLEEIIHQYADSRAFCFFTPEREAEPLIYDHNYPEPQSNEEFQTHSMFYCSHSP